MLVVANARRRSGPERWRPDRLRPEEGETLDEAVERRLRDYRSNTMTADERQRLSGFVRAAVRDARPRSVPEANRLLSALSRLVAWCSRNGVPITRETVLDADTIDHFLRDGVSTEGTRVNYGGSLERVARALPETAPFFVKRRKHSKRPLAHPPYSDAELTAMVNWVEGLAWNAQGLSMRTYLYSKLACGAQSEEIWALTGNDVYVDRGYTVLRLTAGKARTVVVPDEWAPALLAAAEVAGDGPMFAPGRRAETGQSAITRYLDNLRRRTPGAPDMHNYRLVTTCVYRMLRRGVPVDVAALCLGVSPAHLARYYDYVPAPSPDAAAMWLSGRFVLAEDTSGTEGR